jgi:YfiH family protein
MHNISFIKANWPAPININAYTTTRLGGASQFPFASFNLADHVGDELNLVQKNRHLLQALLKLPQQPIWLNQTHSNIAIEVDPNVRLNNIADAAYTSKPKVACVILTADCLPILLTNQTGNEIAAIHAGWRGLAAGIIANTINYFNSPASQLLAWLGPAIGPEIFEVGHEVREQFIQQNSEASIAFKPSANGRWLADLYQLATLALAKLGVTAVYGKPTCTFNHSELFFSYRRNNITGRMASLIWFD